MLLHKYYTIDCLPLQKVARLSGVLFVTIILPVIPRRVVTFSTTPDNQIDYNVERGNHKEVLRILPR